MLEEWGVAYDHSQFQPQAQAIMNKNVPWVYWQVIPGQERSGQYDYEMSTWGSKAWQLKQMFQQTSRQQSNQDFSKYLSLGTSSSNPPPPQTTQTPVATNTPVPSQPAPTCNVAPCQWTGHCFGHYCGSDDNDCDGDLSCNNGYCGCSD